MSIIILNMRTQTNLVDVLFRSKLRAKLLGVMVLNPDKMFYVNQLARQLDSSEGSVHRQLTSLHASGLLLREEDGNRVYFRIDESVPIYEDLRNLLLKTVALRDVIFKALDPLSSDISLAFIYGSEARGEATFASDIDLIVVGDVDELRLHKQISKAEEKLNRTINYSLYNDEAFSKKKEKKGLISKIASGKTIPLIGEFDDLR